MLKYLLSYLSYQTKQNNQIYNWLAFPASILRPHQQHYDEMLNYINKCVLTKYGTTEMGL